MKPHLDQFYAKDEENQHGAPTIMSMGIRRNSYVTLSWRADEEKAKEKSMFIHLSIICEGIFWLVHQSWSRTIIASLLLHTLAGWWVVRTICFLLIQDLLFVLLGPMHTEQYPGFQLVLDLDLHPSIDLFALSFPVKQKMTLKS